MRGHHLFVAHMELQNSWDCTELNYMLVQAERYMEWACNLKLAVMNADCPVPICYILTRNLFYS